MSFGTWVVLLVIAASPYSVWQETYDGGNTDKAHGVCLDSANHVLIIGETNSGSDFDSWMIAIDKSGDSIWSKFYDDGADEKGFAIITTHDGSIAFAGPVGQGMKTILCDSEGEIIWECQDNHSETMLVRAITVSSDSVIYSLGYHLGGISDYIVIHGYDYEGQSTMDVDYQSGIGRCSDIVAIPSGYVYVGLNEAIGPCAIEKYSSPNNQEWLEIYDNDLSKGFGLEMDGAGYLFQSGDVATTGSNSDFLLLKWDTTGALIWPEHKAFDLGHNEYCRDIKMDDISDCYLAGWQVRGAEKDAALVKTDSAGRMLWSWIYEMEGDQEIEAIEVDEDGYIYLAGSHHNGTNWDMLVMQVRQPLIITGRVTDSVGAPMENIRVILSGDTTIEVFTDTGGYYGIEVYNGGSYTVSPDLPGWGFLPSSYTYSPLAHRESYQNFSGEWTGIEEDAVNLPYPSWELISSCGSSITLRYSGYPDGFHASVFNASGRKVDGIYATSSAGTATWGNNHSPGVYFIRTCSKGISFTRRVLIVQ